MWLENLRTFILNDGDASWQYGCKKVHFVPVIAPNRPPVYDWIIFSLTRRYERQVSNQKQGYWLIVAHKGRDLSENRWKE